MPELALLHITTPCPALFLGCAVALHTQPPATCPCTSSHFVIPPFQAAHSVCGQQFSTLVLSVVYLCLRNVTVAGLHLFTHLVVST